MGRLLLLLNMRIILNIINIAHCKLIGFDNISEILETMKSDTNCSAVTMPDHIFKVYQGGRPEKFGQGNLWELTFFVCSLFWQYKSF